MKIRGSFILDVYIIKKFLGTYVFALSLLMFIVVIFDLTEKLDNFIERDAPISSVVFDYYFNFIPYFLLLFSPLFTFITVIFFTSKMAGHTEIIAMFSNGLSYNRFLLPYFVSTFIIAVFVFALSNFVIPHANMRRHAFEEIYVQPSPVSYNKRNIHIQVQPNVYVYMESYSTSGKVGHKFSMEEFTEEGQLKSKLISDYVRWDTSTNKWRIRNYYIRTFDGDKELIEEGQFIDTALNISPEDFSMRENIVEEMNISELNRFIAKQKIKGSDNITPFLIEKYRRLAIPFSTFILTLIGVSLSSKKVRGGIGTHIGAGIGLSFAYILFMQFSSQFAIGGSINTMLAVWLPNIVFAIIAGYLYYLAPK